MKNKEKSDKYYNQLKGEIMKKDRKEREDKKDKKQHEMKVSHTKVWMGLEDYAYEGEII